MSGLIAVRSTNGARGRCLVARLFDALSHIYFKPPQTAFSGPVFWTNRVSRFDPPPGDADGNRGPQADLFRPDLHGPCASGTPRIRFPPFTCASLTVAHEDFIQRYFKVFIWLKIR